LVVKQDIKSVRLRVFSRDRW